MGSTGDLLKPPARNRQIMELPILPRTAKASFLLQGSWEVELAGSAQVLLQLASSGPVRMAMVLGDLLVIDAPLELSIWCLAKVPGARVRLLL